MEFSLRKLIDREEFDYHALLSALEGYASPRTKITQLLQKGEIIRVKKGLYVFGEDYRHRPYCRELLANLIYGPSFVSLDYALSHHGLIPERVSNLTSVTIKRPKKFVTAVGNFIYRQAPREGFHLGVERVEQGNAVYLIASGERALSDKLRDCRGGAIRSKKEMASYLFDDLRVERELFEKMDLHLLNSIVEATGSRKGGQAAELLAALNRKGS